MIRLLACAVRASETQLSLRYEDLEHAALTALPWWCDDRPPPPHRALIASALRQNPLHKSFHRFFAKTWVRAECRASERRLEPASACSNETLASVASLESNRRADALPAHHFSIGPSRGSRARAHIFLPEAIRARLHAPPSESPFFSMAQSPFDVHLADSSGCNTEKAPFQAPPRWLDACAALHMRCVC